MDYYMNLAYKEAIKAYKNKEIPVGAVIVDKNNKILAKSRNNRQKKHNIIGHAEINAILKAEKKQKDWRLDGCVMYVTLEPCEMCKKIIMESRISKVIYMISKNKKIQYNTFFEQTNDCNQIKNDCSKLLTNFFDDLRQ